MRYVALLFALILFATPAAASDALIVAIASSLYAPAQTLAARFEARHKVRVKLVPGSTGLLFSQIVHGAPYAVFMAADASAPERLARRLHVQRAPTSFARGRLFVCTRIGTPDPVHLSGTVVMADPRLAPYGKAASEVLHVVHRASRAKLSVVYAPNVMLAASYLRRGLADAAFVASSAVNGRMREMCRPVDTSLYRPIRHRALLLEDTPPARAWLAFIRSPDEAAVWRRAGFDPVDQPPGGGG